MVEPVPNMTINLIAQARDGQKQALGQLVQLWYKRIYNFAYKYFADHDLAMEAAQKTFISMYKNLGTLQDPERFKPWLYTIAINHCHAESRSMRANRMQPLETAFHTPSAILSQNPEHRFQQGELADILQESLRQLSEEQRVVVIMKEYEGLKFREIAEALDISENTVKSRMYYGLEALKKILEKRNITPQTVSYGN